MSMTRDEPRVALLWHGDQEARRAATLKEGRFRGVARALRAVGIVPEPAVYSDELAAEVREQLRGVDGVLVWVNPIEQGRDRTVLDALLREAAELGTFVSAHPDTILKMGTKEVLVRTREMSWGTDTHVYRTLDQLRVELPGRLEGGARVLKQYRGNGGNGIWRVERHTAGRVRARHAQRGSTEQVLTYEELFARIAAYFTAAGGCVIDQAYQERLPEGMVRCYLVRDRVTGFGHQAVNALYPAPPGASPEEAPQPGPRLYHPPDTPDFQPIRRKMESEWIADLCATLGLERDDLPVIWDADLLLGPKTPSGEDTYVLCEINASSVYPFPEAALEPLARAVRAALSSPHTIDGSS
jgi:hypothetical protein